VNALNEALNTNKHTIEQL
jgi:hypothetical protein